MRNFYASLLRCFRSKILPEHLLLFQVPKIFKLQTKPCSEESKVRQCFLEKKLYGQRHVYSCNRASVTIAHCYQAISLSINTTVFCKNIICRKIITNNKYGLQNFAFHDYELKLKYFTANKEIRIHAKMLNSSSDLYFFFGC